MNFDEVRQFAANNGYSRIRVADELQKLAKRAAIVESELDGARLGRDTARYTRLLAEKDMLSARMEQARAVMASCPKYATREGVRKIWNDYAEEYNATFKKKYDAFKEARKALCGQFLELCEMQRQILTDRETVNRLVNDDADKVGSGFDTSLEDVSMMDKPTNLYDVTFHGVGTCPETAFFAASGEIGDNEAFITNQTVLMRMP